MRLARNSTSLFQGPSPQALSIHEKPEEEWSDALMPMRMPDT